MGFFDFLSKAGQEIMSTARTKMIENYRKCEELSDERVDEMLKDKDRGSALKVLLILSRTDPSSSYYLSKYRSVIDTRELIQGCSSIIRQLELENSYTAQEIVEKANRLRKHLENSY